MSLRVTLIQGGGSGIDQVPAVQRILIPPLARLGARRGIRAGHIGERA